MGRLTPHTDSSEPVPSQLLSSARARILGKDVLDLTACMFSLSTRSIARKLQEHERSEKTGEASADAAQDTAVPSRFCPLTTERFLFHTRALDGEGRIL